MDPGVMYGKESKVAQKIISNMDADCFPYTKEEVNRASEIVANIDMFINSPREKKCKVCGQTKSVFGFRIKKGHLDGRDSVCKECRIKQEKEKRMASKAVSAKKKVCNCCGKELPITEFYNKKNSKDGHASICKDCARERNRESYKRYQAKKKGVNKPLITDHEPKHDITALPVDWSKIDDATLFKQLELRNYVGQLKLTKVETFNIGIPI